MRKLNYSSKLIFPVIYNEGLLFRHENGKLFLWRDNQIQILNEDELKDKEIHYPESLDEMLQITQAIEILFNRIQQDPYIDQDFLELLVKIKSNQEKVKKNILKAGL